ncbi:MAG: L,D-transpeptidase [Thermoanaerobacteraceae bacterium]|nr:L,D-transpeptidase [Thermoanaerobacteraceae bacterium]
MFPESMTVLDVSETTPVSIKELPSDDSKSIGIVYGSLMHVDVIQNLKNGYSEISSWDYASMNAIKGFVPTKFLKTIELDEKYGIIVELRRQKVYIYENDSVIKTFLCSSGLDENNYYTPKGLYRIGSRGDSFFSPKYGQGAYHWVRFSNNYLFHSVPFDENQNIIEEEAAKLGQKASHGCIRLSMDDALWLYNNIPQGTPVLIKD